MMLDEQGLARPHHYMRLATWAEQGRGLPAPDLRAAQHFLEKAISLGHAFAHRKLATILLDSTNPGFNPRRSFSLLCQSSQAGDVEAMCQAAQLLDEGRPPLFPQDTTRGLLMWEVAALHGSDTAKAVFMKRVPEKLRALYVRAFTNEFEAAFKLGALFDSGRHAVGGRHPRLAMLWYLRAALHPSVLSHAPEEGMLPLSQSMPPSWLGLPLTPPNIESFLDSYNPLADPEVLRMPPSVAASFARHSFTGFNTWPFGMTGATFTLPTPPLTTPQVSLPGFGSVMFSQRSTPAPVSSVLPRLSLLRHWSAALFPTLAAPDVYWVPSMPATPGSMSAPVSRPMSAVAPQAAAVDAVPSNSLHTLVQSMETQATVLQVRSVSPTPGTVLAVSDGDVVQPSPLSVAVRPVSVEAKSRPTSHVRSPVSRRPQSGIKTIGSVNWSVGEGASVPSSTSTVVTANMPFSPPVAWYPFLASIVPPATVQAGIYPVASADKLKNAAQAANNAAVLLDAVPLNALSAGSKSDERRDMYEDQVRAVPGAAFLLFGWSAALGCNEARKNLAMCYAAGRVGLFPVQEVLAAHWYVAHCTFICAVMCYVMIVVVLNVSITFYGGVYVDRLAAASIENHRHAREKLEQYLSMEVAAALIKAIQGDALSQTQIGQFYDRGNGTHLGVGVSLRQSTNYTFPQRPAVTAALTPGSKKADPLPPGWIASSAAAAFWYQRAASQIHPRAVGYLAVLLDNTHPHDLIPELGPAALAIERRALKVQAIEMFQWSSERGDPWALKSLGSIYETGRDGLVKADPERALLCYVRSVQKGLASAAKGVARTWTIVQRARIDQEIADYLELKRNAEAGDIEAMVDLARVYFFGPRTFYAPVPKLAAPVLQDMKKLLKKTVAEMTAFLHPPKYAPKEADDSATLSDETTVTLPNHNATPHANLLALGNWSDADAELFCTALPPRQHTYHSTETSASVVETM
jgi:TPR repeat protein